MTTTTQPILDVQDIATAFINRWHYSGDVDTREHGGTFYQLDRVGTGPNLDLDWTAIEVVGLSNQHDGWDPEKYGVNGVILVYTGSIRPEQQAEIHARLVQDMGAEEVERLDTNDLAWYLVENVYRYDGGDLREQLVLKRGNGSVRDNIRQLKRAYRNR
jgi:hypothetical protein